MSATVVVTHLRQHLLVRHHDLSRVRCSPGCWSRWSRCPRRLPRATPSRRRARAVGRRPPLPPTHSAPAHHRTNQTAAELNEVKLAAAHAPSIALPGTRHVLQGAVVFADASRQIWIIRQIKNTSPQNSLPLALQFRRPRIHPKGRHPVAQCAASSVLQRSGSKGQSDPFEAAQTKQI